MSVVRLVTGAVAGVLVGLIAIIVAIGASGAGHGSLVPAALLFPLPTMCMAAPGDLRILGVVLALAQFPLYGLWLGHAKSKSRQVGLGIAHAVLAAMAVGVLLNAQQ